MGSEAEPAKQLLPYLQRADELQKHEPLVAYYCRLFAMERGLKIPTNERTKTTNSILISLMKQLEKDKKSVKLSSDDNLFLEGFASNVFTKADRQDRAGRADLNTAKTFYAAGIFFEVLEQFGGLQPDIEQKLKYALWKAADIRKALREGRKPEPGPPAGKDDVSMPSTQETKSTDDARFERSESFSAGHPAPEISSQHPDNIISSSHALPTPTPFVYPGSDFHSASLHRAPVSRPDDSAYQQLYNSQRQPSEPPNVSPSFTSHEDAPPHIQQPYHSRAQALEPPPVPTSFTSHEDAPPHTQQPYDNQTQASEPPHMPSSFPPHETLPRSLSHEQQHLSSPFESNPSSYTQESSQPPYSSYPNFQTYPSFGESSLPATPHGHYSPYHQSPEPTHLQQPPPPQDYRSSAQYNVGSRDESHAGHVPSSAAPEIHRKKYSIGSADGSHSEHAQPSGTAVPTYTYDSNYQPSAERIAEAHKAARFAVGSLAFDDVPSGLEFLRKALELLTNPKAEMH